MTCLKINKNSDLIQATKDDQRVTWIGSILRKTNLDEFPHSKFDQLDMIFSTLGTPS